MPRARDCACPPPFGVRVRWLCCFLVRSLARFPACSLTCVRCCALSLSCSDRLCGGRSCAIPRACACATRTRFQRRGWWAANAERSKRLAEQQAEQDRKNTEKAARRAAALAATAAATAAPAAAAAAAAKDDDDDDDAPAPPSTAAADATAAAPALLEAAAAAASGTKSTATLTPVQKFTEADGGLEIPAAAAAAAADGAEEPEVYKGEKPNPGNGGKGPRHEWTQTLKDLVVTVPVPLGTTGKALVINITKDHIKVGRKGETPLLLDGKLHKQCRPEEVIWTIDDNEDDTGRIITLEIPKKNQVGGWVGGWVGGRLAGWVGREGGGHAWGVSA